MPNDNRNGMGELSQAIRNAILCCNHFFLCPFASNSRFFTQVNLHALNFFSGHVGTYDDCNVQICACQVSSVGGECGRGCVEHLSCLCFHQGVDRTRKR